MELSKRGSFHTNYALSKERRPVGRFTARLLDCMLAVAPHDDPDYFENPGPGEFAVVDVVTKEKAWFDMPHGATPEIITGMIENTFAASAFRVGPSLWIV